MKRWRCEETLRMVTRRQRPQFSLSYWLQSQERHINRQCFSPLGYSPSWATHAFFVTGVDEFEVVSAVSDFPALSVCHGLLLGLLSLVRKSVCCEEGSMMKTTLKTHYYTLHQSKVYNTWRELSPSIPIQLLSWSRTPGNCHLCSIAIQFCRRNFWAIL